MKRSLQLGFLCGGGVVAVTLALGGCGEPPGRGEIHGEAIPSIVIEEKETRQKAARSAAAVGDSQILFGDLHVHTTFSPDAFIMSVPLMGGTGLHPPADACDFARYCSNLDFWSVNDHAEGITPRRWQETRESIRECNQVAGDPQNPDMVSFLGWEWSQVNTDPGKHYGHKNVIFMDTDDDQVPTRAIGSPREQLAKAPMGRAAQLMMSLMDFENRAFYWGIQQYYDEVADTPVCEKGVDTRNLPENCREIADDPWELFAKLDQWGFDSIVIPHGNSWGMNTPASTSFDKQLNRAQHDPDRQILFEVYSGHGNSEEYRSWRGSAKDENGALSCPAPGDDGYLPCCWRAGQIIRERCAAAGLDDQECGRRETQARQNFVDAGNSGHLTVPGQQVTDWLNCGTCPDCFNEPMDHRPMATAQYAMALTDFEQPDEPMNFRFGLIGSSDNHRSKAGTGYKQVKRKLMTEAFGADNPRMASKSGDQRDPLPYSVPLDTAGVGLVNLRNMERQNSFWLTGGLVATHSNGRNRGAIWDSLKRREVYATSGDRILLWFDLLRGEQKVPMGSETRSAVSPRFRVSAVGAFKQQPGCPEYARNALGKERLELLCGGECYNPTDERHLIDRIEVVRIRPQAYPGEPVDKLVQDPWRSFDCSDDPSGCQVEFEDEDFVGSAREALYYVRAIQEATPMINADNVRCEYDENGVCIAVNPCYGDYRTPNDEDCLAPAQQRAWSSPIFVAYQPSAATGQQEESE
jgi:hypothetical protein